MNQNNLQPLNNRILIEVLDEVQEYAGQLELAPSGKEKSNIGKIISLPLGYTSPNQLKAGDRVMFNPHTGSVLNFDKFSPNAAEFRLIKEEDLLGQILPDEASPPINVE